MIEPEMEMQKGGEWWDFLLVCGVVAGLVYVVIHVAAAVLGPKLLTTVVLLMVCIAMARLGEILEK